MTKKSITIIISLIMAGIDTMSAWIEILRPSFRDKTLSGLISLPMRSILKICSSMSLAVSDMIEITTMKKSRQFQKSLRKLYGPLNKAPCAMTLIMISIRKQEVMMASRIVKTNLYVESGSISGFSCDRVRLDIKISTRIPYLNFSDCSSLIIHYLKLPSSLNRQSDLFFDFFGYWLSNSARVLTLESILSG